MTMWLLQFFKKRFWRWVNTFPYEGYRRTHLAYWLFGIFMLWSISYFHFSSVTDPSFQVITAAIKQSPEIKAQLGPIRAVQLPIYSNYVLGQVRGEIEVSVWVIGEERSRFVKVHMTKQKDSLEWTFLSLHMEEPDFFSMSMDH